MTPKKHLHLPPPYTHLGYEIFSFYLLLNQIRHRKMKPVQSIA